MVVGQFEIGKPKMREACLAGWPMMIMKYHFINFEALQYTSSVLGINRTLHVFHKRSYMLPFSIYFPVYDYHHIHFVDTDPIELYLLLRSRSTSCVGKLLETLSISPLNPRSLYCLLGRPFALQRLNKTNNKDVRFL